MNTPEPLTIAEAQRLPTLPSSSTEARFLDLKRRRYHAHTQVQAAEEDAAVSAAMATRPGLGVSANEHDAQAQLVADMQRLGLAKERPSMMQDPEVQAARARLAARQDHQRALDGLEAKRRELRQFDAGFADAERAFLAEQRQAVIRSKQADMDRAMSQNRLDDVARIAAEISALQQQT